MGKHPFSNLSPLAKLTPCFFSFINAFMVNMALTVAWCLFGVMFYFYGKTFRRWTKDSSVHKL
jgi:hypothetical protein